MFCHLLRGDGLLVWAKCAVLFIFLSSLASGTGAFVANAQGLDEGVLTGRVLLEDGKPAARVRLHLVRVQETGLGETSEARETLEETAMTDDAGRLGLLRLASGSYRVEADDLGGRKRIVLAEIQVRAEQSNDVTLRFGARVLSSAVHERESAGADARISGELLRQLPIDGLEWESAQRVSSSLNDATAVEDSNVRERDGFRDDAEASRRGGSEAGSSAAASGLSYAGLPVTQNEERVDGFSNEQSFRSGPRGAAAGGPVSASSSYGQSSLRSLHTLPRSYSAEHGIGVGSGIAIRTREGSDHVHGGAFYLFRDSAFAATNPYSTVTHYASGAITNSFVKPTDRRNQFGAFIGLPLRWKHSALFGSVEQQVRSNPIESTPSNPNFYALSATQQALLRNRGVTAASQNAALNYLDSLSGPVDRSTTRTLAFVRLDTRAMRHDRLTAAFSLNHFRSPAGSGFDQNSDAVTGRGRASVGDRDIDTEAVSLAWRHELSSHLSNELKAQWARDDEKETPRAPLPQEPAIGPGGFAPQVSIEPDGFSYGTPAGLGRSAFPDEQRIEVSEGLLLASSRHLFSIGGDWSRVHDRIAQLNNAEGSFLYDSGTTNGRAGGLVDWITDYTFSVNAYPNGGCPSINSPVHNFCFRSFTQSFGGENTEFVTHHFSGFAQDHYRIRNSLSLQVGVRYEYLLLPIPQNQNTALDAAFAGLGGALAGATSSFPEDRNNFGPRLSLAWTPASGLLGTFHVGYGAFYGRLTGATVRAALMDTAKPSSTTQIRITPATEVVCPQNASNGFGFPCTFVAAPPAAVAQTSSALLFAANFRLPAVQRASLTWNRSVGKHVAVRAEYAMSLATQLPGSTDVNIAPATAVRTFVVSGGSGQRGLQNGQTFTVPLYTSRRVAQYGPVTAIVSNANSTYHSGMLEAETRGIRWIQLRGSFTYSRAIDYGPQLGATPRQNGQFDPYTNGYDKGLSSLGFPVRFTGELLLRSNMHRGGLWARRALNDWQLASIAFAGSGAPYSYGIFGGTRLTGGRESINGSGGANYLPTVGRNTLRLPPRASVDMRLSREWKAGSSFRLSAFAEAFNLLNQRSLSRVETRAFLLGTPAVAGSPTPLIFQDAGTVTAEGLTTRPFGVATSSTAGLSRERQAEVGVRISF